MWGSFLRILVTFLLRYPPPPPPVGLGSCFISARATQSKVSKASLKSLGTELVGAEINVLYELMKFQRKSTFNTNQNLRELHIEKLEYPCPLREELIRYLGTINLF